jgi:copper chaperone CopZ
MKFLEIKENSNFNLNLFPMKPNTLVALAVMAFSLLSQGLNAQYKATRFQVSGNCEMCKSHIENALDIKGVKHASWNQKTKELKLKYDTTSISEDQIMKAIADVGYDTPKYKADSASYQKLSPCCQYRKEK